MRESHKENQGIGCLIIYLEKNIFASTFENLELPSSLDRAQDMKRGGEIDISSHLRGLRVADLKWLMPGIYCSLGFYFWVGFINTMYVLQFSQSGGYGDTRRDSLGGIYGK